MANTVKDLVANLKDVVAKLEAMDQNTPIASCTMWKSSKQGTTDTSMNVSGVEIYASKEEDDDESWVEFGVILTL